MRRFALIAFTLVFASCRSPAPISEKPLTDAREVSRPSVAEALDEAWRADIALQPIRPYHDSIQPFLDRVPRSGWDAYVEHAEGLVTIAQNVSADGTPEELLSARVLAFEADANREVLLACKHPLWVVDPDTPGSATHLLGALPDWTGDPTAFDAPAYDRRLRQIPMWLSGQEEALRDGMSRGYVASSQQIRRAVEFVHLYALMSAESHPLANPAAGGTYPDAIDLHVRPALERYKRFLDEDLSGASKTGPGLSELPGGPQCYAAELRRATGGLWDVAGLEHQASEWVREETTNIIEIARAQGVDAPSLRAGVREMNRQNPLAARVFTPRFFADIELLDAVGEHPWLQEHAHDGTRWGRSVFREQLLRARTTDSIVTYQRTLRRLRLAARVLVDLRVHREDLSHDDGVAYLIDTGGYDRERAERTFDEIAANPARAAGRLGTALALSGARDRLRESLGAAFRDDAFVEAIESIGAAPPNILLDELNRVFDP